MIDDVGCGRLLVGPTGFGMAEIGLNWCGN